MELEQIHLKNIKQVVLPSSDELLNEPLHDFPAYDNTKATEKMVLTWTNRVSRSLGRMLHVLGLASCSFCCSPYFDAKDDHHALITEFGRFKKALGPGTHKINLCSESKTILADEFINDYQHGVLIRNGQFVKVLPPQRVFVNPLLNEKLLIKPDVSIEEDHIGALIREGRFVRVLHPGVYFPNPVRQEKIEIYALVVVPERHQGVFCKNGQFIECLAPGKWPAIKYLQETIKVVAEVNIPEGHEGLLLIDGKFQKKLSSGPHFANAVLNEKIIDCSMQITTKELVPQVIVTKDTTSFTIKGILVYQIVDSYRAICTVENIDFTIREQIKSLNSQILSEHDLDFIMANKLQLSQTILERVKKNCEVWGVHVSAIDIKDVILPEALNMEMTASARAKRAAESMLIKSRAEVENAEAMQKVAAMLDSTAATHMREIDTIKEIFKNPNVKVLFVAPNVHGLMDGRALGKIIQNEVNALSF